MDDKGKVWVSDFGANAILSFDPKSQAFDSFPSDKPDAAVRQLNGRAGEVWGAEIRHGSFGGDPRNWQITNQLNPKRAWSYSLLWQKPQRVLPR